MKTKPLILLFLLLFSGIKAQNSYYFKNYGMPDGLPSNQVYQVKQDSEKNLWFATDRGVCLYDGHQLKVFDRKDGLPDEVVFGIFPRSNGQVWFYTYHKGLCYYEDGVIKIPSINQVFMQKWASINSPVITNLFIDKEETLWISTRSEHCFKIDRQGQVRDLNAANDNLFIQQLNSPRMEASAYSCRTSNNSTKPVQLTIRKFKGPTLEVGLTEHLRSNLSTETARFFWLNEQTLLLAYGSKLLVVEEDSILKSVELGSEHKIHFALYSDHAHNFWVGTEGGVFRFTNSDFNRQPEQFLAGNSISSIWQDHEGGYWFSSLNNGVFYIPHFKMHTYADGVFSYQKPMRIKADNQGIYVSTYNRGLFYLPEGDFTKTFKVKGQHSFVNRLIIRNQQLTAKDSGSVVCYFKNGKIKKRKPLSDQTYLVHNDSHSPFYWYKNSTIGKLCWYGPEGDSPVKCVNSQNKGRPYSASISHDLSQIWLGTASGLWVFRGDQWICLGDSFPEFRSAISDLDLISDSILLVTSRGYGVLKYFYRENRLEALELPNLYCHESILDYCGTLWIASFSGLTRVTDVEYNNPKYFHFSTQNGLLSNEVYEVTEFRDHIWVATGKGLCHWPLDWIPKEGKPSVQIDRTQINGQNVALTSKDKLATYQNNLQFHLSSVSFQNPVSYQYRLLGLHSNWLTNTSPEVSYSDLKPGDYTLQVKSSDSEGVQGNLAFSINFPLWQRWWFIVSVILVLLSATVIIMRLRYRIIRKENKLFGLFLKAEQKALRSQVNPHFLFNSFNSILELLVQKKYGDAQNYLRKFARLMRSVLEFSRKEEISLVTEIEFLKQYIEIEKKRFDISFQYNFEIEDGLNAAEVKIPTLLLQPYVENALKHGIPSRTDHKAKLIVKFSRSGNLLIIQIIDNGKGVQPKNNTRGHLSYGMKINGERMELFGDANNVKVSVSAGNTENPDYHGTIVHLQLPLKQENSYETATA